MTDIKLTIEPLTAEAFAPYGDVIEVSNDVQHFTINNGSTERYHDLAKVETDGTNARTLINIFRAQSLSYPLQVKMMERHPYGSQAFIPLSGKPYLVLVAPLGDELRPEDLRIFSAKGTQGVNYHKNMWHHPILALEGESDFLVVDRGGEEHNCEERFFSEEDVIYLSLD
ncbi:ureidoglycolate lyase [Curvivirga aplysinae]|uniref:ureidoglycolate lyase n=1 Tax=Curvivirga aplysinae TaxID=2529852 RepID=UPI0012BBC4D8|nr:ureidoglycolate lyase [Curvivirga aplysinae]MTI08339.1 ureidoglycolate lyase [Curvivirga aplysinae]